MLSPPRTLAKRERSTGRRNAEFHSAVSQNSVLQGVRITPALVKRVFQDHHQGAVRGPQISSTNEFCGCRLKIETVLPLASEPRKLTKRDSWGINFPPLSTFPHIFPPKAPHPGRKRVRHRTVTAATPIAPTAAKLQKNISSATATRLEPNRTNSRLIAPQTHSRSRGPVLRGRVVRVSAAAPNFAPRHLDFVNRRSYSAAQFESGFPGSAWCKPTE
jgi:hypothetical protein